jgi:hypothetical protein
MSREQARLDSNQQPAPYKSDTLTVELRAGPVTEEMFFCQQSLSEPRSGINQY